MAVEQRLKDKVALVTGASRGIGRAVAKALAAEGAHVVITARTAGALEELDDEIHASGGTATLLTLDLAKFDRIDQLGPTLFHRWGKLDIFVATAGVLGPLSPLGHVAAEAWSNVIDINLNANFRLVRTLVPLLTRAEAGRAVFVTSGAATGDKAYWGPYAVSKAGVEALARTMAAEADDTPLRVNVVQPGGVRTQMRQKAFPGEDPATLPVPEDVAPLFVSLCLPSCKDNGRTFSYRQWAATKPKA